MYLICISEISRAKNLSTKIMIKVFLREKKLKNNKRGLYLDFYPPIVHPETLKETRREHLRLFIHEKPKTEIEREHNKETKILGENIRSKRQLDLQSGAYGFATARNKQKDFLGFFKSIVESKKKNSKSNYESWISIEKHLIDFTGGKCRAGDVTEKFCENFKNYLLNDRNLAQNTAAWYFDKFKFAVKQAFENSLLPYNPVKKIKGIETLDSQREFLTVEELQKLLTTPFKYEDLRRAAFFSVFTGLRFSDIQKLTWGEIQKSKAQGDYIRFRQKKTGYAETLPISEEAAEWLGEREEPEAKAFPDMADWQCEYIAPWVKSAGIEKHITFHCFRHTNAVLQLSLGTDVYTVSKMLGHRNIKTTQIYAKVIDEKKRAAANKISLK